MKPIKYSSIDQFRKVIKDVNFHFKNDKLPILTFYGTVKIHGTNCSVIITRTHTHTRR